MIAIPKALAMANPKHVVACVATVAGVISSKFAIDTYSISCQGRRALSNRSRAGSQECRVLGLFQRFQPIGRSWS